MSVQQLISYLGECRRRLSELRSRQDYPALSCAILRLEGKGGTILYHQPFYRVLNGQPFHDVLTASHGETFTVAFYSAAAGMQSHQIPAALAHVEAVTREIHPLLRELPRPVRDCLQLPNSDKWWRVAFHLAWHFPRPFLQATRCRLLARDGSSCSISDETFVQLHGTGGLSDLLPGLIYSHLQHDLCTFSEAALGVISEALEQFDQRELFGRPEAQAVLDDQRRAFDRLRAEFLAGTQLPMESLECKLLKLADSFETPAASEWADLKVGGCIERFPTLSWLNDTQEIVQIRGPGTDWFCKVAERAGNALPKWVPNYPILFDDVRRNNSGVPVGISGPRPIMNRGPLERWVGFVFATLKHHQHEALQIRWGTRIGPLAYGLATLDLDLFAASVLAMDLNRLVDEAGGVSSGGQATEVEGKCAPGNKEFGGWQILGDAPADQVEQLPTPAAGRFVIALAPPTVDGWAEMRGETRYIAGGEYLALLWENLRGERVLHPTDGIVLMYGREHAYWLPDGWEMDVFPIGWTLPHLEGWFSYAFDIAKMEDRGDIRAGSEKSPSYAPTPRGLVTHAHLMVRHLGLAGSPTEPRGPMDRAGCLGELRDILRFFRQTLEPGKQPGERQADNSADSKPPVGFKDELRIEMRARTDEGDHAKLRGSAIQRDAKAESRDRWLYRQASKKNPPTWKSLMAQMNKKAETHRWRKLSSPQAVEQALDRYIKRNGLDLLPPRKDA